ncbi:MAG: 3-deoxy-8-phosphooctulonate synthase [Rhodobacteraceae bacterium]|nr:MAG: 3-deoxy-8-phosphooctulonate synthase [Paracoccaceae bacterium]
MAQKIIDLKDIKIGNELPMTLIAGPCQLETEEHAVMIASNLAKICYEEKINFVFKGSFDKANRTSVNGTRGVGLSRGLQILSAVKEKIGCAVLTDIHNPEQCREVSDIVDILQIPAFLCRQTDIILAASKTNKVINIKKGQFLAPWDMEKVLEKALSTGNQKIMLCERGSSFGYNTLVTDFRSLPIMKNTSQPVIMDATHSVQIPGGKGDSSGGQREYAPIMATAAAAIGVAGIFIETHQDPDNAPSDGANMVRLDDMANLVKKLREYDKLSKGL